jgi:hypothetical protein
MMGVSGGRWGGVSYMKSDEKEKKKRDGGNAKAEKWRKIGTPRKQTRESYTPHRAWRGGESGGGSANGAGMTENEVNACEG